MAVNAMMVTGSFDRMSGTATRGVVSWDAGYQPLNKFQVRTTGAPIVQGQITRLAVAEVMLPYAIPTIIRPIGPDGTFDVTERPANNSTLIIAAVKITVDGDGNATYTYNDKAINLPQGFYTGEEMVDAINAQLATWAFAEGWLIVEWDNTAKRIRWYNNDAWESNTPGDYFVFYFAPFITGSGPKVELQKPRLAWTIGLRNLAAAQEPIRCLNASSAPFTNNSLNLLLMPKDWPNDGGGVNPPLPIYPDPSYYVSSIVGAPYSGRYTDYIDIVSNTLCANQFVRDGNTNQNVVKKDIIARVYIADDNSYPPNFETGSRPFLIHRQFNNMKVMKWTVERSIDAIDLALYDMFGQPLPVGNFVTLDAVDNALKTLTSESSDFAITFHVFEPGWREQSANSGYRM